MRDFLTQSKATAAMVIEGVRNARAAGQWRLAMRIGWAGFKLVFWDAAERLGRVVKR